VAESEGAVTVVEPAASRMAALVTGFSLSLELDEPDEEEVLEELEEVGFEELEEGEDGEDRLSALAFSRSLRAFILADLSLSSSGVLELELEELGIAFELEEASGGLERPPDLPGLSFGKEADEEGSTDGWDVADVE
jgi:hypothetical protein